MPSVRVTLFILIHPFQVIRYFDACFLKNLANGTIQSQFVTALYSILWSISLNIDVEGFFGYGACRIRFHSLNLNLQAFQWYPHFRGCQSKNRGVAARMA